MIKLLKSISKDEFKIGHVAQIKRKLPQNMYEKAKCDIQTF